MRHLIAGTAGHIDHGKTALVRALTGIDTDRLEEEKRRGISIDIGFAHLQVGDDSIGLVDVPGHERFIKNMLAGVAGIDFVLFIIAADESIKPQTREHFEICRLLRIPRGIVVLTKADVVDPDILELVRLEVEEFVAGSFLEGAPVVAVSSVTGAGLPELRDAMIRVAAAVPAKEASHFFRLPVDRSFSLKGFGTVVTGTLVSGNVRVEDEVELYPGGRRVRVRSVQVHGRGAEQARAGQRTALNLTGVDAAEVRRGMVLSEPGRFAAVSSIDTRFELLAGAHPLKHRAPVHFHAGTAEVEAEVRLLESTTALEPGASGLVRFLLREPVLLLPGDRFIVRMFSPVVTIGGGRVLDIGVPRMRRADAAARLAVVENGRPEDRIGLLVRESPYGEALTTLVARTGMLESEIRAAAGRLVRIEEPQPWWIDPERWAALLSALEQATASFHKKQPLAPGIPREELRTREIADAPTFVFDALLRASKTLIGEGEVVRLRSHKVVLQEDESEATGKMEALFRDAGLAVPALNDVLAKSGVEPVRARALLQLLLRGRRLVKVGDDLVFHSDALSALKQLLAPRKGQRFSVAEFKDWTGISRKYAIPLLEYLDRERVTRREGDSRVVL